MKYNCTIADTHCDTLLSLCDTDADFYENDLHFSLKPALDYAGYFQIFAAWVDQKFENPVKQALVKIDRFYAEAEKNKEHFMPVFCRSDIDKAFSCHKVAAMLSIEGGEALGGSLGLLRMFYRLGVRSVCLTWNYRNEIADPAIDGVAKNGLSRFGTEVVAEMNRLGMLIDVSHLSETAFYDVIAHSKSPIIASHSCSKALCGHFRNLTDDQFRTLCENGGVVGINFCPAFLRDDEAADVTDVVRHIEHFLSLGGENHVGLGSDFDGVESLPDKLSGVCDMHNIIDELQKLNYSDSLIRKISSENMLNLIETVIH